VKNRLNPIANGAGDLVLIGHITHHALNAFVLTPEIGTDMVKQHDLFDALLFAVRRAESVKFAQCSRQAHAQKTCPTRDQNVQSLYLMCVLTSASF
jgi:hypothetical protein